MADISLKFKDQFADITIIGNDLFKDDGLETAIIASLFTDRRVRSDELPKGETDRSGWWGDMIPDIEGDQIGSKLWLLRREKQDERTRVRFQDYARESLQWLLDDGVAQSVDVVATYPVDGVVRLDISIQQPQNVRTFSYERNWFYEGEKR